MAASGARAIIARVRFTRPNRAHRPSLRALAGGLALIAVPLLTARVRGARNGVSSEPMAVREESSRRGDGSDASHSLPDKDTAVSVLEKMILIRRFEERAGEMYAKAKIGGF